MTLEKRVNKLKNIFFKDIPHPTKEQFNDIQFCEMVMSKINEFHLMPFSWVVGNDVYDQNIQIIDLENIEVVIHKNFELYKVHKCKTVGLRTNYFWEINRFLIKKYQYVDGLGVWEIKPEDAVSVITEQDFLKIKTDFTKL
jgi:hypothetical protein